MNPVLDGLFYHSVQHMGRTWAHYGRFVRLDRGRVIEHTWMSEATRGIETMVTVSLEPQGDRTLLTLKHVDIPDDDLGRSHEQGWYFIVGAVEQRFTTQPRSRLTSLQSAFRPSTRAVPRKRPVNAVLL